MKKTLALVLAVVLSLACCSVLLVSADESKTWENTQTTDSETGNLKVEVPYGYVWQKVGEKDLTVNGMIGGEDITICTTDDAYANCNPKWAITIVAQKQSNGLYKATADAIVGRGEVSADVKLGNDTIAIVVHSSSSKVSDGYANTVGKVVALSVKTGDLFKLEGIDLTNGTAAGGKITAIDPNAKQDEPASENTSSATSSQTSSETSSMTSTESSSTVPTGDAGLLVFAVLGVVSVIGAAVACTSRR